MALDLGSVRALALDLNLSAHGVDVTIVRAYPDDTPIETKGIWVTPLTDGFPAGFEDGMKRREPQRVMALSRAIVPTLPRGTLIHAPELAGGVVKRWRTDGLERLEGDHRREWVIPDPDWNE